MAAEFLNYRIDMQLIAFVAHRHMHMFRVALLGNHHKQRVLAPFAAHSAPNCQLYTYQRCYRMDCMGFSHLSFDATATRNNRSLIVHFLLRPQKDFSRFP